MSAEDDTLQEAIHEVQKNLCSLCVQLLENLTSKVNSASTLSTQLVENSQHLARLIPEDFMPQWLKSLLTEHCNGFKCSNEKVAKLSVFVAENLPLIEEPILIGSAAEANLDELFNEQRDKFLIHEHFDRLVSDLGELIAEDVIEHRTVEDAIRKLKAVFQVNRRGSLAAVMLAMNYGNFVKDSFGGLLAANKHTKPIYESWVKEFKATETAVNQANAATKQATIRRLVNETRLQALAAQNPEMQEAVKGYLPSPSDLTQKQ